MSSLVLPIRRLGEENPYISAKTAVIPNIYGSPLGVASQAIPDHILEDHRDGKTLKALDKLKELGPDKLYSILARAADIFLNGDVEFGVTGQKLSPQQYVELQSAATGSPVVHCHKNMTKVHRAMTNSLAIMESHLKEWDPNLNFKDLVEGKAGKLQTDVFAATLPSNSAGVHQLWVHVLAILPTLLKPGSGDVFSTERIRNACVAAGMPADVIGIYPGDGASLASTIAEVSKRRMLFGDENTVHRFRGNPQVDVHGPGFSKIVFGPDEAPNWRNYLDLMVESITDNGGKSCICASAVYAPEPYAREIADALVERIGSIKVLPLDDADAKLAAFTTETGAQSTYDRIKTQAAAAGGILLTDDATRVEVKPGHSFLRPVVVYCDQPTPKAAKSEYLGPVVFVVNTENDKGYDLKKITGSSLIITAITRDQTILDNLSQGDVHKLNIEAIPTVKIDPMRPLEGNLPKFLFGEVKVEEPFTSTPTTIVKPVEKAYVPFNRVARPATSRLSLPTKEPREVLAARAKLDQHVVDTMEWHFNPETGTPYWIRQKEVMGFDPREKVKDWTTFLEYFKPSDKTDDVLRTEQPDVWVPNAFKGRPYNIFETGGSTGMPKQRIGWDDYKIDYEEFSDKLDDRHFPKGENWLMVGPTGPRRLRLAVEHLVNHRGGSCQHMDFDPRIVKEYIRQGKPELALAYKEHVIANAITLLTHRKFSGLFITPPVLSTLMQRIDLYDVGIRGIFMGGTTIDPEWMKFVMTEGIPEIGVYPTYGNTLMGLAASVPVRPEDNYGVTYYAPQPRAVIRLVDPANPEREVGVGEVGRVELTTMTKEFFLPRFLERDIADYVGPREQYAWNGVLNVRPYVAPGAAAATEGVY